MKDNDVKKLNDTTWLRKTTILGCFIMGWVLTIAGFIAPPLGVIDNSVLVVLGQALTYCCVGLGLKGWTDIQTTKIDNLINKQ